MKLTIEASTALFDSSLARYMAATKKLPDYVLEKKGRDLGIRLYRGFAAHKWGGAGKKRRGLGFAELAARTAAGKGTLLRPVILDAYRQERAELAKTLAATKGRKSQRERLSNLWRIYVGKEIKARERGIGMLAASFLWYRKRTAQARGTYYVPNRTGKRPLGHVERTDETFRIVGEAVGIGLVDDRYGITASVLRDAAVDMMNYVRTKERANFAAAFGALKGAA